MLIIKSNSYPKWKLDKALSLLEEKGISYQIILQDNLNKSMTAKLVKYCYQDYSGIISSHSNKYKENKDFLNNKNINDKEIINFIYQNPSCLHGLIILDDIEKATYNNLEYLKLMI